MKRKILVLGYVLGLMCVLYRGVEDDNDHRRPGPVKGKTILPKKVPLSTDKPGPNVEEPGKNSKTKELTECEIARRKRSLNDSLIIKVYVKEEIRNNKKLYNREKIAKIFNKKYGLIEIKPSEDDVKRGRIQFFIPIIQESSKENKDKKVYFPSSDISNWSGGRGFS